MTPHTLPIYRGLGEDRARECPWNREFAERVQLLSVRESNARRVYANESWAVECPVMTTPFAPLEPTGAVLGDEVYALLGEAILDGRLSAGERLRDQELAERLGVSRTPVREALQRLSAPVWSRSAESLHACLFRTTCPCRHARVLHLPDGQCAADRSPALHRRSARPLAGSCGCHRGGIPRRRPSRG